MVRAHQDPNGTAWSKDKTKMGFKMLEKMGWKEGKGLGRNEDGATEHIKVKVKAENVGVGSEFDVNSWKVNTTRFEATLSSIKGKAKKRSGSEASASSEAAPAGIYVPKSPTGSPKTGPLISSRRSFNRKLIKAKAEFKKDEKAREVIVGKAKNEKLAKERKEKKQKKQDAGLLEPASDNLTEMQRTATLSMADYFANRAKANGEEVTVKATSSHVTFASFNAGLALPPAEELKRKREGDDEDEAPPKKKEKKSKKEKKEAAAEEAPKKKEKKEKKEKKSKK